MPTKSLLNVHLYIMHPFASATQALSYPEFIQLTETLVAQGRTTGPDQSEALVHYTKLNLHRMKRWNKTFHPREDLVKRLQLGQKQTWWVITEPWCGDSSQSLPIIALVANAASIPLHIVLRDDNPDIMDQYLTNGSQSIPVLIAFDENGHEIFRWGPRPEAVQQIVIDWKRNPESKSYDDLKEEVHGWYARDKGAAMQEELLAIIDTTTASPAPSPDNETRRS